MSGLSLSVFAVCLRWLFDRLGCVHGRRAGLLVAVSDVRSWLQVGFVAEALVDHLAVDLPPASVPQELLPCSGIVVLLCCSLKQTVSKATDTYMKGIKAVAVSYPRRRAWSRRTISLVPTRRSSPPPACCSEWPSCCPCSSCTYRTSSHPRHRGVSPAERKGQQGVCSI